MLYYYFYYIKWFILSGHQQANSNANFCFGTRVYPSAWLAKSNGEFMHECSKNEIRQRNRRR